ncbi:MAG: nuclear transport factor 2 family protein [Caldilineaceae bacterium]
MIQPSTELMELMTRWYARSSAGDSGVIEEILSHDPALLTIGTDPAEWLMGFDAIAPLYQAQIGAVGDVKIAPGQLLAFSAGDVGWVADCPRITLPDGTSFTMRSTLVFHREKGAWKLIQQHNSVGVSNEELVGSLLPLAAAAG